MGRGQTLEKLDTLHLEFPLRRFDHSPCCAGCPSAKELQDAKRRRTIVKFRLRCHMFLRLLLLVLVPEDLLCEEGMRQQCLQTR